MEDTESHKIFLLGGYDLEMLTIKRMLMDRRDCVVIDKHLRWDNALLSAYKNELEDYDDSPIYGIELKEDILVPSNYIRIDHHNDLNCNTSALEQVAEILGVELSRYQQLVAANDKGYIPAMEAMGATETEIENIRMTDRVSQGIGPDDAADIRNFRHPQLAGIDLNSRFEIHPALRDIAKLKAFLYEQD